jgi:hypothetical protein
MNAKTIRNNQRTLRSTALAGAIVTALTVGVAGTAAADGLWAFGPGGQVMSLDLYMQQILNAQLQSANVSGSPTTSQIGYQGPADSVPLTVADNAILGAASGNDVVNTISLGALDSDAGNAGLAILSGQVDTGNIVSATTAATAIGLDITDYTAGNATVTDNAIAATTLVNDAGNVISGDLNTDAFNGSVAGTLTTHYDPVGGASAASDGGVIIGNAQLVGGADANASVVASDIALVNDMTAAGSASAAPVTVVGNAATAASTLNRANNSFAAGAGGAVSYAGSVAVSNGQATLASTNVASVTATDVGAELADTTFQGALSVSDNTISASAKGNEAAATDGSGNLVRGNSIAFAEGVDVTGLSGEADIDLVFGASTTDATVAADLALVNSQGNQDGDISGTITAARIGGSVQALDGGTLTATGNHADASASGNSAINLVSADSANFAAGVGVGNQQTNDATNITANATAVTLGVEATGPVQSIGDATVGDSAITASASGSSAQTRIDVAGANLTATTANAAGGTAYTSGFTQVLTVPAGMMASNQQANYGAGSSISAEVDTGLIGATFVAGLDQGSASVQGNAITASASGNSAGTGIATSGSNGELTAMVISAQYDASDVSASLEQTNGFVGVITGDGALSNVSLTVGDNRQGASATANQASNSLSTDFDGTLTTQGGSGAGSGSGGSNSGDAGLIVSNSQIIDGASVEATVNASAMGVHQGDAGFVNTLLDSSITVQGNAADASAIGNSAGSALSIGAGSLAGGNSGLNPTIGSVSNLQQTGGDTSATNSNSNAGYYLQGDSAGLSGTVTDNGISAFTAGNFVGSGNLLTASGTNLSGAADATSVATYDGTFQQATAAFVVLSTQMSTAGTRTASVTNAYLGGAQVGAGSDVADSTLTVTGNDISADARDNYVVNGIGLEGFSNLSTTAAISNTQSSNANMDVTLATAGIGLEASAVSGTTITVSDNALASKAVGNTATNTLVAEAANLGGNAADYPAAPGYRGAVEIAADGSSVVVSDYSIANEQSRAGSIANAATGLSIGTSAIGGDFNGASTATVNDNSILVLSQSNSAGNRVALSGSGVDASSAIRNEQDVTAGSSVTASATGVAVGVLAAGAMDAAMPLTVTGNSVNVNAGFNEATNALAVEADGSIAGNMGAAGASNDSATYAGLVGATGDFVVANDQAADGAATATLAGANVIISANGDIGAVGGNSSLTISGNDLGARSSGNNASNSIALNGDGSVDAAAALFSSQAMAGSVSANVSAVNVAADAGAGSIEGAAITVDDNHVSAIASANTAVNSIAVSGASLSGAALNAEAAGDTTLGTSTAIANYALNNVQSNSADVSATMNAINIGTNLLGGTGSLTNSIGTVNSNSVAASASGNSASNSILLASATGMPSAALTNTQVNSATITASINGATIGIMAGGVSNSPATISGNVISASAVGNSAVNQIGIGD